ncbi:hypothetical protein Btru_026810 [Bulinus truncatus]|nr:hypothetical protein Btru_026810 [Bulinus truncatus]
MKESLEKSVTLEDVSLETLELILQILYIGCDVLTHDNVRDIWFACHRLQTTRYSLASKSCLLDLYNNELTQTDPVAKDIFFKAISYQLSFWGHGFWPTAAIHRFCDNLEHIGVICDDKSLSAIVLRGSGLSEIVSGKYAIFHSSLAGYESQLFGFTARNRNPLGNNRISVLKNDRWKLSLSLKKKNLQDNVFLLAHEKCIYLFSKSCGEVHWFNPNKIPVKLHTLDAEIRKPKYLLSYHGHILIFCSVVKDEIKISKVYCWDT